MMASVKFYSCEPVIIYEIISNESNEDSLLSFEEPLRVGMSSTETRPPDPVPRARTGRRGEEWRFVTADKDFTVEQFYHTYQRSLPLVAVVTQGYYGDIGIEIIGNGQAIYIQKLCKQQRVVAEMHSGKKIIPISIPTVYRARFCIVEKHGPYSREYPLAEILRVRKLPCDVQFSQKSQYNLVSVEGTNMATANVRIRLLRTYDERYLVGNPLTEKTIYEDVMVVPFYLEGLRLSPVTGIRGYPSTWPSFLRYLSVAKITEGGKFGNSDIAIYKKIGAESFKTSCVVPETYLSISEINAPREQLYEELQRKKRTQSDKVYDILWDSHTGCPVLKERQSGRMLPLEEKQNKRYVEWRDAKLSNPKDAKEDTRYAKRPLPHLPTGDQTPTCSSLQTNTLPMKPVAEPSPQPPHPESSSPNAYPEPDRAADTGPQRTENRQTMPSDREFEWKEKPDNMSGISDKETEQIQSREGDSTKLPPVPERKGTTLTEDLEAPGSSTQRRDSVPRMSVSDLQHWLGLLRLEQYADSFRENDVDGGLLLELTEDVLVNDFGMSKFHAIKLRKFVTEGYLPRH